LASIDESPAPPSSLLGRLQRGRGAGFLAALAEDPAVVQPLLLHCILEDPRSDRQGEQRADYYARLALHVHLPIAPLEDYLRSHADDHPWSYSDLPFAVLARMAWRGNGDAAASLARYLHYGWAWADAFEALVGGRHAPRSVRELGQVILARFPEDASLLEGLDSITPEQTIWDKWAAVEPRFATILRSLRDQVPYTRPSDESIRATVDPTWDIATLLSHAEPESMLVYGEIAAERASASDLPALLNAFFGDVSVQVSAASHALTILKLPEVLPALTHFVEEFDGRENAQLARYRIGRIRRILAATPEALTIARAWLRTEGWARPSVALSILEEQSEEIDVPPLRALLHASIELDPDSAAAAYFVEGCLDALRPFAAQIPYADPAHVFERTGSMWNRRKAGELMVQIDPAAFRGTYAVECLWDCEDEIVIEIGCTYADLSMPLVRDRLRHLQHSPYESDAVRAHAEARLQAVAF
jgi:hypothetical protein